MRRESGLIDIQLKRIFLLQFFAAGAAFLNSLADGIVSSMFLGSEALSVIALYTPVNMLTGLLYVFITGANMMSCESIGRGEVCKVRAVFSTCLVLISAIAFMVAVFLISLSDQVARILGADITLEQQLSQYIRGMAIGIPGIAVTGLLTIFLAVNNNTRLAYVSLTVSLIVNVAFNFLGVALFPDNMFGIGLATSISAYVSVAVLLRGYRKNSGSASIYFIRESICFDYTGQIIRFGSTKFFLTVSMILTQYIINTSIINNMGHNGTAVLAVFNTTSSLRSAITSSLVSAVLTLGSIFYSQRDRKSFEVLFYRALRFGLMISLPIGLIMVLCRGPISSLFFETDSELWHSSCEMLIFDAVFIQFNLILFLLLFMYRSRQKTMLVDVITVVIEFGMAAFVILALNMWSHRFVWSAFPLNDLATIFILFVYAWIRNGKISLKSDVLLDLADFDMTGSSPFLNMTLTSKQDALDISKKIYDIGIEKKLPKSICYQVGLCLDELVMNILSMELRKDEMPLIQVYVCTHDEELRIYIWDNGASFDTKAYIDQFVINERDISKNIGLRIVAKLADELTYQNRFGLNFITIRFSSIYGTNRNRPGENI